ASLRVPIPPSPIPLPSQPPSAALRALVLSQVARVGPHKGPIYSPVREEELENSFNRGGIVWLPPCSFCPPSGPQLTEALRNQLVVADGAFSKAGFPV
ncbi:hypothetical protein P7K49_039836, partial [Saguinus oedipus]